MNVITRWTHAIGIPSVSSSVPKRLEGGDGRGPWVDMTCVKAGMWESQEWTILSVVSPFWALVFVRKPGHVGVYCGHFRISRHPPPKPEILGLGARKNRRFIHLRLAVARQKPQQRHCYGGGFSRPLAKRHWSRMCLDVCPTDWFVSTPKWFANMFSCPLFLNTSGHIIPHVV